MVIGLQAQPRRWPHSARGLDVGLLSPLAACRRAGGPNSRVVCWLSSGRGAGLAVQCVGRWPSSRHTIYYHLGGNGMCEVVVVAFKGPPADA